MKQKLKHKPLSKRKHVAKNGNRKSVQLVKSSKRLDKFFQENKLELPEL